MLVWVERILGRDGAVLYYKLPMGLSLWRLSSDTPPP